MTTEPHDLRQLFRAIGSVSGARALEAAPADRTDLGAVVDVLDEDPAEVVCDPLEVSAYVDGIQASMVMTHRMHRPVYLSFVSAGAVASDGLPLDAEEELTVVCSHLDREWVDELGSTVPVHELAAELPPDVERAGHLQLGGDRSRLESVVIERAVARGGYVVSDGALTGRKDTRTLVGVVKTHGSRYLPDESVLYGLAERWRSPRFRIPAGHGAGTDRWSCYVRLRPANFAPWTFGLIRLETFSLDLLEPLAAATFTQRQSAGSGDARFDRHLFAVRRCEDFLRARRPQVY